MPTLPFLPCIPCPSPRETLNDIYGSCAPLILFPGLRGATVMALRFKQTADLSKALSATESVITTENPGYPFEYKFADENFDALFSTETLIGRLAGVFATLAVFISCLGLFGLAAYTAERRAKEIGIRKVLGASTHGLAGLLSREFLALVILSCLIAFPIAWWAMNSWLGGYEYRTGIHWWVFAVAGAVALVVALFTVGFQAIRTAIANPIKALKSE
jgi:putative ABC transport system permease protein